MNRRGFLAAMLAAGMAPAIVRASSLMPVIVRVAPVIRKGGLVRWVTLEERAALEAAERIINPPLMIILNEGNGVMAARAGMIEGIDFEFAKTLMRDADAHLFESIINAT